MGGGGGRGMGGGGRGVGGGGGQGMGGGGRGMGGGGGQGMGGGGRGMGGGSGQGMNRVSQSQADRPAPSQSAVPRGQEFAASSIRRLAVTSEGPAMTDRVDPRFGRAAGFVVVDLETMESSYVDNGASQALAQGAGIQAAETLANAGVQAVITGYVGPKAFTALSAAGIRIGQGVEDVTVAEAVRLFTSGSVSFADTPNSQSGVNK
jgi:predicted Fe-Mo cluster-binding NifX family protein